MIELSQIPISSKLKDLRGQINTMANEINTDQMVIGQVVNPSANIYGEHGLICAVTASQWLANQLFALCMPESNGVYVAQVFGILRCLPMTATADTPIKAVDIDIPAVRLPNRNAVVSTFVAPDHLGFTQLDTHDSFNTGLSLYVSITGPTGGLFSASTDVALSKNSAYTILNSQTLTVSLPDGGLRLSVNKYLH